MDFDYLLGALLGDGCLYIGKYAYQFTVSAEDYDLCDNCNKICFNHYGKYGVITPVNRKGKFSYYQFRICSKDIVFDLIDITKHKTIIPPITNKIQFVHGLMDTDGWITKVNASDGYLRYRVAFKNTACWTEDFHKIINELGVKTGKLRTIKNIRNGVTNKDAFEFSINAKDYCEKIGFGIFRKIALANECLYYYEEKNGRA